MQPAAVLLVAFPLLGFLINGLAFPKLSKPLSAWIGCIAVLASFLLTLLFFIQSFSETAPLQLKLFEWMATAGVQVSFGFWIDRLTLVMLLVITGVGFLIHVYSVGYMKEDAGMGKFFAFLNLFIFFMLLLVMADSFLVMFIGWEGVGLCSYLLIGFWWKNSEYTAAANKAFIMNRIGDLGFLLALFLMFHTFGSTDYREVFRQALSYPTNDATVVAITLLLFVGAIGKSAQIPLYTWLPDAMAGPTPVSALIHAATMVTAGVYLVVRSHMLYTLAPVSLEVIIWIGTATSLWAALIALRQDDIKKVLAYSTVSQLGFMFAAAGAMALTSSMLHLIAHAFFKALLFLGAGSVIHALHHEQNMRHMGGLRRLMPVTFVCMAIGTLAISGVPPLAGFFSKDEILLQVASRQGWAFIVLVITSVLTAAYMFRLLFMVFYGNFRGTEHEREKIHESPRVMTVPLMVLALLSGIGGVIGLPALVGDVHALNRYLSPVFLSNPRLMAPEPSHTMEVVVMILSVLVAAGVGVWAYRRYHLQPVARTWSLSGKPRFYRWMHDKFYVDECYQFVFVRPAEWLGDYLRSRFDPKLLDGLVEGLGRLVQRGSALVSRVQTGSISGYLLWMVGGLVFLLWYALTQW
ncbi:MAG: NADH-quinone oxidoreductase subunit L [Chitinophagales bacterium]|nr:NADH-quinone oxidoreductase subunit L [Chitinophagales bacterium]MDW8393644.1 NADH-quinone oxidoreductase subunit L [Chitinophagales bacterium]